MRADSHYVDLLTSRPAPGRERVLSTRDIEAAPFADASTIQPLIESVARYGLLQPLLVQHRHGHHRLIAGHKRLSAARAAGILEVPCRIYDVDDEEAARLGAASHVIKSSGTESEVSTRPAPSASAPVDADADLEKALVSLAACTDFVSGAESELSRSVANTLLRAEVWRASCLLKATRVLLEATPALRTTLSARKVLDQVLAGFAAERRLRMIEFDVKSSLPHDGVMICDERLLLIALSSAVRAILSVFDDLMAATIRIVAAAEPGDSDDILSVSEHCRGFRYLVRPRLRCGVVERPGGQAALVSMLAVKSAVETLGGEVVAPTGRGTRSQSAFRLDPSPEALQASAL